VLRRPVSQTNLHFEVFCRVPLGPPKNKKVEKMDPVDISSRSEYAFKISPTTMQHKAAE
jgi:hypothetical protein